ncbi:MAG: hypothetical protein HC830_07195 [Bacteroidetes bacterium]|nr:hypothetical protein [Bacteroidota bacterium]
MVLCRSQTLNSFIPFTNLFLYDIKHIDCEKHIKYTGVGNEVIIKNLSWLLINNILLRIRIPVIPGFNYNKPDMYDIITFLRKHTAKSIEIDLLPYHSIAAHKYLRFNIENRMEGIPSLNHEDLKEIFNQFEAAGFSVTIGG